MRGKLYGVGVGPGDPELMTLKAVRLIRENEVIAIPTGEAGGSVAYRIAEGAVPEIREKELVTVPVPMTKDRQRMQQEHEKGARILEKYLAQGLSVVYLTLGDPTIYSSFSYLQHILEADGYEAEPVSAVTSFCAAAARLKVPLTEWDEPLHIIPAACGIMDGTDLPGTCVLMKSASRTREVRKMLMESGRNVYAVENCGMETEKIYRSADEIPDEAGYFTLIIAK